MSDKLDISVRNKEIFSAIERAEPGSVKEAAVPGSKMIRRRIREDGFIRNIIPPETVTNENLDRVVEHDRPVIIEDMEPDSKGAVSLPFGTSTETEFYYGTRYECVFNVIATPEYTKDINELRTYTMDLRKYITDNALRDMQTEEDASFLRNVNNVCGAFPVAIGGVTLGKLGVQQSYTYEATNFSGGGFGFDRNGYVMCLSNLENNNLNNGVFLMNRFTAKNFLRMDRSEAGGDLSQELLLKGTKALQEATVFGVKHLFTIKGDLVPNQEVYHFAEPQFLGKFYVMQEPTMYVEKKKDILSFCSRETISMTIANMLGVSRSKWIVA
jgi:hypothetical protein